MRGVRRRHTTRMCDQARAISQRCRWASQKMMACKAAARAMRAGVWKRGRRGRGSRRRRERDRVDGAGGGEEGWCGRPTGTARAAGVRREDFAHPAAASAGEGGEDQQGEEEQAMPLPTTGPARRGEAGAQTKSAASQRERLRAWSARKRSARVRMLAPVAAMRQPVMERGTMPVNSRGHQARMRMRWISRATTAMRMMAIHAGRLRAGPAEIARRARPLSVA